jgi:hypothetical protein
LDPQTDAGYKDFSDSVLSELALFILDDRARIRAMILAGDRNLPRYLEQAFINRCQDRVRTPQSDPMRYFRKRAGEVLRHADGIYTTTDGAGFLAFSLRPQSEERALPPEVDLCAIPLPGSLAAGLDYAAACRKGHLALLAAHFWEKISEQAGRRPVWVGLRDFVRWVACYVPMMFNAVPEEEADLPPQTVSKAPGVRGPAPGADARRPPLRPDAAQCRRLAGCFCERLDPRDREVFYLKAFGQLAWTEIAARTGYSGPSGPHYAYERIEQRLRSYLRDWPGLSPEDLDEEACELFLAELQAVLKERLAGP